MLIKNFDEKMLKNFMQKKCIDLQTTVQMSMHFINMSPLSKDYLA